MIELMLGIIILIGIINIILLFTSRNKELDLTLLKEYFDRIDKTYQNLDKTIKDEFVRNREEFNLQSKEQRQELSHTITKFGESLEGRLFEIASLQKNQLDSFSKQLLQLSNTIELKLEKLITTNVDNISMLQLKTAESYKEIKSELTTILKDVTLTAEKMNKNVDDKLNILSDQLNNNAKNSREELSKSLKLFQDQSSSDINKFNIELKEKFDLNLKDQKEINNSIELRLERIRTTVEEKLQSLQEDNTKKLDEMRNTVDEKLQSTLEKRLGDSFKLVSERLELVHKGLGEMQVLANGVGDLKKVLSNVKTRGVLGEYQLANLLEQILTPDQYSKNVKTIPGSNANVEFAIKLPGREDASKVVWLPIDSKFPTEDYQALLNAYENGDVTAIEENKKFSISN